MRMLGLKLADAFHDLAERQVARLDVDELYLFRRSHLRVVVG